MKNALADQSWQEVEEAAADEARHRRPEQGRPQVCSGIIWLGHFRFYPVSGDCFRNGYGEAAVIGGSLLKGEMFLERKARVGSQTRDIWIVALWLCQQVHFHFYNLFSIALSSSGCLALLHGFLNKTFVDQWHLQKGSAYASLFTCCGCCSFYLSILPVMIHIQVPRRDAA